MRSLNKLRRAELIAQLARFTLGLAAGRKKGAQVQRLGAALRQSLIDRAVSDALQNPDVVNWRINAVVNYLFSRQCEIGLRPPYSRYSLDRRVRASLRKYSAERSCQSDT